MLLRAKWQNEKVKNIWHPIFHDFILTLLSSSEGNSTRETSQEKSRVQLS